MTTFISDLWHDVAYLFCSKLMKKNVIIISRERYCTNETIADSQCGEKCKDYQLISLASLRRTFSRTEQRRVHGSG